jgi:hypothetical protein
VKLRVRVLRSRGDEGRTRSPPRRAPTARTAIVSRLQRTPNALSVNARAPSQMKSLRSSVVRRTSSRDTIHGVPLPHLATSASVGEIKLTSGENDRALTGRCSASHGGWPSRT